MHRLTIYLGRLIGLFLLIAAGRFVLGLY